MVVIMLLENFKNSLLLVSYYFTKPKKKNRILMGKTDESKSRMVHEITGNDE